MAMNELLKDKAIGELAVNLHSLYRSGIITAYYKRFLTQLESTGNIEDAISFAVIEGQTSSIRQDWLEAVGDHAGLLLSNESVFFAMVNQKRVNLTQKLKGKEEDALEAFYKLDDDTKKVFMDLANISYDMVVYGVDLSNELKLFMDFYGLEELDWNDMAVTTKKTLEPYNKKSSR